MARYTDAVCRLCRREGLKLFLKGERCYTDKCAIVRRNSPPGEHGQGRSKFSEYAIQLREKQKVKRIYRLMERQFHRYFVAAEKAQEITGEKLLLLLEQRLDNMVYRMGFATSRSEARQLVRHGHFYVDGRKLTSRPSCCGPAKWSRLAREDPMAYLQLDRQDDLLPVEGVPWYLAAHVAGTVGLRLPLEAEWEYGCRAGATTRFCFGDDVNDLATVTQRKLRKNGSVRRGDPRPLQASPPLRAPGRTDEGFPRSQPVVRR